jgi:putative heme iron utilization protein
VLSDLNDFVLFDLKPIKGSYVNGFGSAYFVDENLEIMEHRRGAHGEQNRDK